MAEKSLDQQLWDVAGYHGTADEVRALLARGANAKSQAGSGALTYAVHGNRVSIVEILLAAGALIDGSSFPNHSPLMEAPNAHMAQLLLDRGARVDGTGDRGDALHFVIERGDDVAHARLLLDRGLRQNGHLDRACRKGRAGIARLLLERGARTDEPGREGRPVVEAALFWDDVTTLVFAEAGASFTPAHLEIACQRRSAPIVAVVLGKTTGDATPAAERAAERGDVEILRILIESDRVPRLDAPLRAAAALARTEVVDFLLHCGADPRERDVHGGSALHAAARGGSVAILDRFVAAGCPYDVDGRGRTALHHAAMDPGDAAAMLRELAARGLDLEALDKAGATAIDLCATFVNSNAYDILLELGADDRRATGRRQKELDDREKMLEQFR